MNVRAPVWYTRVRAVEAAVQQVTTVRALLPQPDEDPIARRAPQRRAHEAVLPGT